MGDEQERTLWVGGLCEKVTEELLYELFLQAGPLEKVKIATEKDGRKKTFAFVTFKHSQSVPYTIELMSGTELFRQRLKLQSRPGTSHNLSASKSMPGPGSAYVDNSSPQHNLKTPFVQQMSPNMMMPQQSLHRSYSSPGNMASIPPTLGMPPINFSPMQNPYSQSTPYRSQGGDYTGSDTRHHSYSRDGDDSRNSSGSGRRDDHRAIRGGNDRGGDRGGSDRGGERGGDRGSRRGGDRGGDHSRDRGGRSGSDNDSRHRGQDRHGGRGGGHGGTGRRGHGGGGHNRSHGYSSQSSNEESYGNDRRRPHQNRQGRY